MKKNMSSLLRLIVVALLLVCTRGLAQDGAFVISQQGFYSVLPIYQAWADEDKNAMSELSVPLLLYMPLGENIGMHLNSALGMVKSDFSEDLSGMADTQVNWNYYSEAAKLLFNLGVNVPTGKKKLSLEEFETSYLLSLHYFNFQVPSFGQGWNVSPGVSWAIPLSETIVLGLGASVQYRGPFEPFENMAGQYDPGDEILLTGGLDFRVSEAATFSTDFVFTSYGTDKLNDEESFRSGKKIAVNAQYRMYIDRNELWLFGRYRSRDKNQIAIAGGMIEEDEKTIPDMIEVIGRYRFLLRQGLFASVQAEGRFFKETAAFTRAHVLGVGFNLDVPISPRVQMPVRLKLLTINFDEGSNLTGLEIGAGMHWSF